MSPARTILALLAFALAAAAQDTDGDGLSDFEERHKYFTDPAQADTDGDGTPDGDWEERREYAYTVRSVVRVMRPAAAISDDYQDARLLRETDEYVELEVVHYPFNTVADAIEGDAGWRTDRKRPKEYLASTTTSDWDRTMRKRLLAELKEQGVDPKRLDDRTVAEKTAALLMRRSKSIPGFTTFFVHFPKGRAAVLPGLEAAAENGRMKELALADQWERELFAKGMFEHGTRGSCTSSAIYLAGGLRAVGIPARIVLCIPVVDASDGKELEMVRRLKHHRVRSTILGALEPSAGNWSSHTFNEVWVGGRWRRLNYTTLGQNILDRGYFGLMTHVLTVRDWADARAAETIGRRQGLRRFDDAFGHRNPYSTIELSEHFGAHATIANEPLRLTVEQAIWYDAPGRPEWVSMRLDENGDGHVLLRVKEIRPDQGPQQYAEFWNAVDHAFVLRAEGHPEVRAEAARGYWARESGWFYVRIPRAELTRMVEGVDYALSPRNGNEGCAWVVADGVTLTLRKQDASFAMRRAQ